MPVAVLTKSSRSQQNVSIINPHVHLMGEDAAVVAYVRVTQMIDK